MTNSYHVLREALLARLDIYGQARFIWAGLMYVYGQARCIWTCSMYGWGGTTGLVETPQLVGRRVLDMWSRGLACEEWPGCPVPARPESWQSPGTHLANILLPSSKGECRIQGECVRMMLSRGILAIDCARSTYHCSVPWLPHAHAHTGICCTRSASAVGGRRAQGQGCCRTGGGELCLWPLAALALSSPHVRTSVGARAVFGSVAVILK